MSTSSDRTASTARLRVRWAAIGAAVAVTLGAGTLATVDAARSSGERNAYFAVVPCRLADTRPASQVGDRLTPLGPTEVETFDARGAIGECTADQLPTDATALELNVTPTQPTTRTFLTFWPDGTQPNASSLNPEPGEPPTPNSVTVPLAADGSFKVFNNAGSVHVAIDVVGFYADHDHDDRYYTEGEIDALLDGVETAPTITKITYNGQTTAPNGTAGNLTKLRDIGSFTSNGGTVKITWASNVRATSGGFCDFGIRVNGAGSGSGAGEDFAGTEASMSDVGADIPVMTVDVFTSLAGGTHDLDLYVRGGSGADCTDNFGNFPKTVLIEEYPS